MLSTTHATDSLGAAARLADLGVDRTFIAEVLTAVIVQTRPNLGHPQGLHLNSEGAAAGEPVYVVDAVSETLREWIASGVPWTDIRTRLPQPVGPAPRVTRERGVG